MFPRDAYRCNYSVLHNGRGGEHLHTFTSPITRLAPFKQSNCNISLLLRKSKEKHHSLMD